MSLDIPKTFKPTRANLGVRHGILDILVSKIILDASGILAIIGQLKPARMSQYVLVNREAQLFFLSRSIEHLPKGRIRHGYVSCTLRILGKDIHQIAGSGNKNLDIYIPQSYNVFTVSLWV